MGDEDNSHDNVLKFPVRLMKQVVTAEEMMTELEQESVQKKNRKNKDRMEKERRFANEQVINQYRLRKSKGNNK